MTLSLDADTTDLDDDGSYFYENDGDGTAEVDFREEGGFIIGALVVLREPANPVVVLQPKTVRVGGMQVCELAAK